MRNVAAVVIAFAWPLLAGAADLRAIDGDTLAAGIERIRIVGLDTPEMMARCDGERQLAERAKARLGELIGAGEVVIERRGLDRYRRTLAVVLVDGQDIAAVLIAEGLARPYQGGRRRGWCETSR